MGRKAGGRFINGVPLGQHYIGISSTYQAQHIQFLSIRGVLEQTVSAVFAVPPDELTARYRREAKIALARQVAMYMAHVVFGLNMTEIGVLFGRDRTTVGHGCAVVEDRREQPAFDRALTILEHAIREAHLRTMMEKGKPV